jgi:hypothetical protein
MKVYLSTVNKDSNYKWASNLAMLDGMLLDSEGTDIVCDDFISSFSSEDAAGLLSKIASKLRLKGKLTIAEVDPNIIFRRGYNQEISEADVNTALFTNQKRRSIVSLDTILKMLPPNLTVESKTYDHQTCRFVLVVRRSS